MHHRFPLLCSNVHPTLFQGSAMRSRILPVWKQCSSRSCARPWPRCSRALRVCSNAAPVVFRTCHSVVPKLLQHRSNTPTMFHIGDRTIPTCSYARAQALLVRMTTAGKAPSESRGLPRHIPMMPPRLPASGHQSVQRFAKVCPSCCNAAPTGSNETQSIARRVPPKLQRLPPMLDRLPKLCSSVYPTFSQRSTTRPNVFQRGSKAYPNVVLMRGRSVPKRSDFVRIQPPLCYELVTGFCPSCSSIAPKLQLCFPVEERAVPLPNVLQRRSSGGAGPTYDGEQAARRIGGRRFLLRSVWCQGCPQVVSELSSSSQSGLSKVRNNKNDLARQ